MRAQGDHCLTGVDAHPDLELQLVVAPVQLLDRFQDAQARPDRALGVILVRHRRAEDRHHRVADEFLHGAAVALDHLLELGMVRAESGAHVLGVGVLRGGGEAHEVAKEHGDDLAFLTDWGRVTLAEWPRTERAEREVAGELLGAIRACGHGPSFAETRRRRGAGRHESG